MLNKLDKFYTKFHYAFKSCKILMNYLGKNNFYKSDFLEPSAGNGTFIRALKSFGIDNSNITAIDIEPADDNIGKADYLKTVYTYNKNRIIIGNPPFKYRCKGAIDFLNKALMEAPYAAFILPVSFLRWYVQKQIKADAKLVLSSYIEEEAAFTDEKGKDFKCRCAFMIWTRKNVKKNMRLIAPLPRKHNHFETLFYNGNIEKIDYFNKEKYKWDFAFYLQGFYDYRTIITDPSKLIKNRKYLFVKVLKRENYDILKNIDIVKLSKLNMTIPGYSTGEYVHEYRKKIGEIDYEK